MNNPLATEKSTSIGLLLARVPLGALFVVAGFSKFTADGGIKAFIAHNSRQVPLYMPAWFGGFYLNALPYAEILVGAMLVVGMLARLGGLVAGLMLLSFIIAITGLHDRAGLAFHPNLTFVGVALLIFLAGAGRFSLDQAIWGGKSAD